MPSASIWRFPNPITISSPTNNSDDHNITSEISHQNWTENPNQLSLPRSVTRIRPISSLTSPILMRFPWNQKKETTKTGAWKNVGNTGKNPKPEPVNFTDELTLRNRDHKRVTPVRDPGLLPGQRHGHREAHSERWFHRRRLQMGDILLPRWKKPGG